MVDEEFNALFNKLVDSERDMTAEEYIDFDRKTLQLFVRNQLGYGRLKCKFCQSLCDRIS